MSVHFTLSHHKDSLAAYGEAAELLQFMALHIQINCHSFFLIYCVVIWKILKINPFPQHSDVKTVFSKQQQICIWAEMLLLLIQIFCSAALDCPSLN